MSHEHHYRAALSWTGAKDSPTTDYKSYSREYTATVEGKPALIGSADPTFRGDATRHNPEDLLLIALAACHMLSYLALCSRQGVRVTGYEDRAEGVMEMRDGRIRFTSVTLRPRVVIAAGSDPVLARALHEQAHHECYIANSVNFTVAHEAEVVQGE